MAYTLSRILATGVFFVRDWLFCPESVAIFVAFLFFFNVLRLLRALFICFCRWKYKAEVAPTAAYKLKEALASNHLYEEDKNDYRRHFHEAKSHDMAAFSIRGRRKTMEDRFNFISHNFKNNHSVYAVFDGHGGEFAAEYIEEQLFSSIRKEFVQGSFQSDPDMVKQVLTSLIRTVDAQLVCLSMDRFDLSGSTGIIVFQKANHITVANIGDSRAVMCDTKGNAVALSTDHKPSDPKEQQRIVDAGGFVTFNGVWRVAGVLATSRAFGDYPLKQRKFVTVEPDFQVYDIKETRPHFIILATDGLWDVFSNEDAVQFIKERLDEPHFGAKSLALQAYYRGSLDNITVMVINFKKKRSLQRRFDDKQKKQLADETNEAT
ncbi:protein phosphatase 1L [Biomphalaria glabrata]|uniref:Protein phosphatase 1L-like n=1 Tax=Biomphalaria glabrata TaxID=6526 RepID=A0A2C9M5A5_BIOGL|nr:protein phosphatase 1L-like [Biomphalaria glabrata]KAI8751395.1 protein phosphatase 1L-like [Biomphalaria glabrata]KAI8770481.1 protein phosphatase 1L [Biomphalaria glabrata]